MGGGGDARADFNFRERPCYLSNTYEMLPLLLEFIGKKDSGKCFCQGYHMLPWQPDFRRHVQSNFDILTFSLLIKDFFKLVLILSIKVNKSMFSVI